MLDLFDFANQRRFLGINDYVATESHRQLLWKISKIGEIIDHFPLNYDQIFRGNFV